MGRVVIRNDEQVIDYGYTFKSFSRDGKFAALFYEAWLLENRVGCVMQSTDDDRGIFTCNVAQGVKVSIRGFDRVDDVNISWTGTMPVDIQDKLAALYVPDDAQVFKDVLALSTDLSGYRFRQFAAGWLRGVHTFDKADAHASVNHTVSFHS